MSRAYIPTALREVVARSAHHRCGYCLTQEVVIGAAMEIEHIIPEALGGRTEEENLWLAYSLPRFALACTLPRRWLCGAHTSSVLGSPGA